MTAEVIPIAAAKRASKSVDPTHAESAAPGDCGDMSRRSCKTAQEGDFRPGLRPSIDAGPTDIHSARRARTVRLGKHVQHDRCARAKCRREIKPRDWAAFDRATSKLWCSAGCWALDNGLVNS